MVFVHKMRPTIKSAIRSYAALSGLAVVAFFANRIIGPGANYLFMAKPEDTPSVLDVLPENFAIRLIIMGAVVTALYFAAYLPWLVKDIKNKKKGTEIQEEAEEIKIDDQEDEAVKVSNSCR